MTLSACASTDLTDRNVEAAAEMGRLSAGITLPPWPDYCREPMPRVIPKLHEPVWGTQMRWQVVADNENKRILWCAEHYDGIVSSIANRDH